MSSSDSVAAARNYERDQILVSYNIVDKKVEMAWSPNGAFNGLPQVGYDDAEFIHDSYFAIPRLQQMENWIIEPSKNTNWYLFWGDGLCQILNKVLTAMIVGDGVMGKVWNDEDFKEVDKRLSDFCKDWSQRACGSGPDNRGKTINNYVLPLVVLSNLTCGADAWYRTVGKRGIAHKEEVGKFMVKWLDPRSYVPVRHDYYGWFKLVQFPLIQSGLPTTREAFDMTWRPAIRGQRGNYSGPGHTMYMPEVHIPSEDFYWFNCVMRPPIASVVSHLTSKLMLSFFRDKYIEKATFPFFLVKVPRHYLRDRNQQKFDEKLDKIAQLISEYRNGDAFAIEGNEYNDDGEVLSEGWEVTPVELKSNIDFAAMFRLLDEQIAWGLYMSMAAVSPSGTSGQTTHLSTGGEIMSNAAAFAKTFRSGLGDILKCIYHDAMLEELGEDVPLSQITIEFSKIREEDAALFLNLMSTLNGAGALTTNEMRFFADRLGLELDPLPEELTPEGQAAMQVNMQAGVTAEGIGVPQTGAEDGSTEIPEGIMTPPDPEHVRPGYHKHEDVWQGQQHPTETKHRVHKVNQRL
jgi:hypothetical protein